MLALAIVAALFAAQAAVPPAPTRWVEDGVGLLSPATRSALDARLEGYQHATGHQVVVWIGDTLDGAPLDEWAVRTFAAWKVGRQGLDDGVAMFILVGDRAIDLEVGYGLEGQVTDAAAAQIIALMAPRLRAGDRDGAVTTGVEAVLATIEGRPWTGASTPTDAPAGGPTTLQWIRGILAALGFLVLAITHPRFAMMLLWTVATAGRGRGGFAGGGGRSGGGGARGRW